MSSLIVKKFGGTSVGTLDRIRAVADQLIQAKATAQRLVVVVSAMGGETDRLLNLAYDLCPQPEPRELAALMTTGEQVSMSLLAMLLCQKGVPAKSYNASQLAIQTDDQHIKARVLKINTQKIEADLAENYVVIVAGFQGISLAGEVTALGRGGSDTSAVALACALKADECQIFTDVDGVYTADPRLVPKAFRLEAIDFRAMLELASLGSKVLQWRSVALASKYQIPLRVLSSFKLGPGTLMSYHDEALESPQFAGLSHQTQLKRWVITIANAKGDELSQIAAHFAEQKIQIDHVNQMQTDHVCQLSLIVHREDQRQAENLVQQLAVQQGWQWQLETHLARVSLAGIGLHSHAWIAAKFFATLCDLQIKVQEVIYSELTLSVIIAESELSKAAQGLHAVFFEAPSLRA